MKKISLSRAVPYLLLAVSYLLIPLAASAAVSLPYFGGSTPLVSCTGVNCNVCDFFETGQRIIYFITTLTLFVVGPIMVTAGGIMMLISAGNAEKFSGGRKMATGAIIGILIALGAFLIVNTLLVTIAKQIPEFSGSGFTISCTAKSPFEPSANRRCATDVNGEETCWYENPPAAPQRECATDLNNVRTCWDVTAPTTPTGSSDTNRGDDGDQP